MMNQGKRSFVAQGILAAMLFAGLLGCQQRPAEPIEPNAEQLISTLRSGLDLVVEFGEGGSGLSSIFDAHAKLQEKEPELAQRIEKDLQDLGRASTPDKRRDLAKKIQGELPAAN